MGHGRPTQARPVDMGLPSGLQWANCNIGAERASDLGQYFSWGNIEGHRVGDGYDFSQAVYDTTDAADVDTDLSLDQDAARANLGGSWRMPTANEFQELYDNCTSAWYTLNGIEGILFTSNINGNTLFFPAAGYYNGTSLSRRGLNGSYWSSTFVSAMNARYLGFNDSTINPQNSYYRRLGFSVRAVIQLE